MNNASKVTVGVAIVLFLLAGSWGAWQAKNRLSTEEDLDTERLRSESLLSEKLKVQEALDESGQSIKRLNGKIGALETDLRHSEEESNRRSAALTQAQRELNRERKNGKDLVLSKNDLEAQLQSARNSIHEIENENLSLESQLAQAKDQYDIMKKELAMAHSAYYDRPLVESTRGKSDKLVVKARRTGKLRATMLIPNNLKDVTFHLIDPSGNDISNSDANGTLAVNITTSTENAITSTSNVNSTQGYNEARMTFMPKQKLKPGTYKIEVLSEGLTVGSLQLRLR